MAGRIPDLHATARTGTGKGAARQSRRDGLVPGVVYGGGLDPQPINIPFNVLFKMLKAGGFMSTLFNLKVEGNDDVRIVCRGVQRDVVKDLPTHVDFMRLKRDSRVNLNISVEFLNEEDAPGIRAGGSLTVVRPEIELMVTAGDIPEVIQIDIGGMEIGDGINISDVTLPEGTRPVITDRDFVIANMVAPKAVAASDDEDDSAEEAAPEAAEDAAEGGDDE